MSKKFENIHPDQFTYTLPEEYIAKEPLADRASSKLLHYHEGQVNHQTFKDITHLLPEDALLIFNDTRVIPARLILYKPTGAKIEVFLLEPMAPSNVTEEAMNATGSCEWQCMIGNAKKWQIGTSLTLKLTSENQLTVTREAAAKVSLRWDTEEPFSQIIEQAGKVPLPPYIDREPTELDIPRYQTVYSKFKGAVAAPTAGLHFTDEVMEKLSNKLSIDFVTLHVSAGTFQPITTDAYHHPMHREEVIVTKSTIKELLQLKKTIAVGTTSMRTLESLYWYGVKILNDSTVFEIEKLYPYEADQDVDLKESLGAILTHMNDTNQEVLRGHTEIFIFPGYQFRIVQGLITNFHLPGTTLMMLIAAFIGEDWKKIYDSALQEKYRFLSYGDSSLLIPKSLN